MLEDRSVGEECCAETFEINIVEKCSRRELQRSVGGHVVEK